MVCNPSGSCIEPRLKKTNPSGRPRPRHSVAPATYKQEFLRPGRPECGWQDSVWLCQSLQFWRVPLRLTECWPVLNRDELLPGHERNPALPPDFLGVGGGGSCACAHTYFSS